MHAFTYTDVVNESEGEPEKEIKRKTFRTSHNLIYLISKLFGKKESDMNNIAL